MADECVDGGGWISDESSFYGDEGTRAKLEKKAKRAIKRPYQYPSPHVAFKKRNAGIESGPECRDFQPASPAEESVFDFLKSRPQIAALQKVATTDRKPVKKEPARTAGGEEAADLLDDDRFEGLPSARQHNETVDAFLKRARVADHATSSLGPWLWISNPKLSWSQQKHKAKADIGGFQHGGEELLEAFEAQYAQIVKSKPKAAPGTITRLMRPYKEQLEDDLLALAVKTATTCGKWMLFPSPDDYPRYWRLVVEATAEGKLGPTSKAATLDLASATGLICVYTYDFTDTEDVRRVLEELVDLGVCQADGRPIYYKCDAYTYLDIKSDNEYKIRASLYSSKEILKKEAKATQEGPIARLKKRNNTIDSFVAT